MGKGKGKVWKGKADSSHQKGYLNTEHTWASGDFSTNSKRKGKDQWNNGPPWPNAEQMQENKEQ
eukprot:13649085-Heterocapsa_arctica.AAC.1